MGGCVGRQAWEEAATSRQDAIIEAAIVGEQRIGRMLVRKKGKGERMLEDVEEHMLGRMLLVVRKKGRNGWKKEDRIGQIWMKSRERRYMSLRTSVDL